MKHLAFVLDEGSLKHTSQVRDIEKIRLYKCIESASEQVNDDVDTEWLLHIKESTDHELKYDQ